jgi:aspartate/tyrosine/aromatic aminotransferase
MKHETKKLLNELTRSKLRKAAKLAIAIHGFDLMQGFSPSQVGLTESEYEIMTQEAHSIVKKLAGNNPMNLGSVEQCIEHFR